LKVAEQERAERIADVLQARATQRGETERVRMRSGWMWSARPVVPPSRGDRDG
jgi:hypothetical protein